MTVEVIRVNGSLESHEVPRRRALQSIYQLIGCDTVDTVNLRDGRIMLVDDTGLLTGKAVNPEATKLYWSVCRPGVTHPIAGDVAIARDEDFA